jgi:hypothetical protein
VSKNTTWRIWASSGSIPNAITVERWKLWGTVSLSSTLSDSLLNARRAPSSSPEKVGGVG